jgi:hypothetical protein
LVNKFLRQQFYCALFRAQVLPHRKILGNIHANQNT